MNRSTLIAILTAAALTPAAQAKLDAGQSAVPAEPVETSAITTAPGDTHAEAALEAKLAHIIKTKKLAQHNTTKQEPLICQKRVELGSRIKKSRCLTAAEWRREKELRELNAHHKIMEGSGRRGGRVFGDD